MCRNIARAWRTALVSIVLVEPLAVAATPPGAELSFRDGLGLNYSFVLSWDELQEKGQPERLRFRGTIRSQEGSEAAELRARLGVSEVLRQLEDVIADRVGEASVVVTACRRSVVFARASGSDEQGDAIVMIDRASGAEVRVVYWGDWEPVLADAYADADTLRGEPSTVFLTDFIATTADIFGGAEFVRYAEWSYGEGIDAVHARRR